MTPGSTRNDGLNVRLSGAIFAGELALEDSASGVALSDLENLRSREFGRACRLASSGMTSPPRVAVGSIEGVCANQKMVRPDARTNIAGMTDQRAGGDWSVVQLIRKSVRRDVHPAMSKMPVVRSAGITPEPAGRCFTDMVPEVLYRVFGVVRQADKEYLPALKAFT